MDKQLGWGGWGVFHGVRHVETSFSGQKLTWSLEPSRMAIKANPLILDLCFQGFDVGPSPGVLLKGRLLFSWSGVKGRRFHISHKLPGDAWLMVQGPH